MKTANPHRSFVARGALALIAAAMVFAAPVAMAAVGVNIKDIPKLKSYDFPPKEEFEAQTKLVAVKNPYDDEFLSYEVRLPKGWSDNLQQAPIAAGTGKSLLSKTVLAILARYDSKPKNLMRSFIRIEAQELGYEISAQKWFVNFIINNGYSLEGLVEKSPREIEALYVALEGDVTYVVRVRLIVNGSRLVLIRYYLPQENYDEDKVLQAQVMNSFRMTNPAPDGIEKQETYGFLDQSYFNYPNSWVLKEKSILSIERMSATLIQQMVEEEKITLEGYIKIDAISRLLKTTLTQEIESFRKNLNIPGYAIGGLIENIEYAYNPSVNYGKAQVYNLVAGDKVNMKAYEFVIAVMESRDYYYITSMITPSREQDFYAWARNMEAFRIVTESLRRPHAPPEADPNDPYYDYLKEEISQ